MVIAQPVDTEQLDSDVSGGAYSPLRIIPATMPAVCRQSGCREPATGQHCLCADHQAAQRRLRESADQRQSGRAEAGRIIGGPTVDDGRWRGRAACRGMDPALFVPVKHNGERTTDQLAPALAACRDCPVRPECLTHALDAGEQGAVWGGEYLTRDRARQLRAERQDLTA